MIDNAALAEMTTEAAFLRLLIAAALGGAIGLERERRSLGAGFRTTMLTSLAAALFTVIALNVAGTMTVEDRVVVDPIRVIESVTAGVAFLAAGTIISRHGEVLGVTTGASMWIAGAVGVACGVGLFVEAAFATAIALATLTALKFVSDRISGEDEKKP